MFQADQLMFLDLGLLTRHPAASAVGSGLADRPGGLFAAAVLLSQVISNVPPAIALEPFTDDWRVLACGVSVGGFGIAIGSLANLIALRLVRVQGALRDFHLWSLPLLLAAFLLARSLLSWLA